MNFILKFFNSHRYSLIIFIISLSETWPAKAQPYGVGPNPYTPPAHMSLREQAATKPLGLSLDVASGVGKYQDLQTPLSPSGEGRADGSKTALDSSNHTGPLISGRLSWTNHNSYGQQSLGLNGLRMSALPSMDQNAGSSYVRASMDAAADWDIGSGYSILSGVEARRSIFRNTDSGHYIDSVILRTGLTKVLSTVSLSANAGVAPISQFGYMQNSSIGRSGGLASSSSSLYEWNTKAAWSPMRDATLFVGLGEEVADAELANVSAYRALGLNVADDESDSSSTSRRYHFSTIALTLGATRRF